MKMIKIPIIKSDEDLAWAHARLEELAKFGTGTPESDEFEVLATIASEYERTHHGIEPPDPVEAIKETMFQLGLKQRDLIPYIGSESYVSQVLSGRRALTVSMIRRLHQGLKIPLSCLVGTEQADRRAG